MTSTWKRMSKKRPEERLPAENKWDFDSDEV